MDDNKKKVVIGVLVVAVLAIGAFQFTGGGSDEPAATPKKEGQTAKKPDEKTTIPPPPTFAPYTARDPFEQGRLANFVEEPRPQPEPEKPKPRENASSGTDGEMVLPPLGNGKNIPWDVPGPGQGGSGTTTVVPVEPEFKYALVGVVVGETPAAVFADATGGQRLITLGGSLDNDTKLISISQGKAVVKFGKKTITLTIGGTASAK
jgi:hypothetical protein